MGHFNLLDWVDFARGVAMPAERDRMRAHLAAGCPECREFALFCGKLADVCRRSMLQEPPESAVRQTRGLFLAGTPPVRGRQFRIPLEVVFDSFLVPAPAGLRASWQIGWQALYRAAECSLDLRVEPELHTSHAALIGQVSNHQTPGLAMTDLPVCLKAGKVVVAQTRSNRFGEFQMRYEQQKRLQLHVYLDGGKRRIQVPLKQLPAEKPIGENRLKSDAGARRN